MNPSDWFAGSDQGQRVQNVFLGIGPSDAAPVRDLHV